MVFTLIVAQTERDTLTLESREVHSGGHPVATELATEHALEAQGSAVNTHSDVWEDGPATIDDGDLEAYGSWGEPDEWAPPTAAAPAMGSASVLAAQALLREQGLKDAEALRADPERVRDIERLTPVLADVVSPPTASDGPRPETVTVALPYQPTVTADGVRAALSTVPPHCLVDVIVDPRTLEYGDGCFANLLQLSSVSLSRPPRDYPAPTLMAFVCKLRAYEEGVYRQVEQIVNLPGILARPEEASLFYAQTGAFEDCPNLISVELPRLSVAVKQYALAGCSALEMVRIPPTVESIHPYAFDCCTSLRSVTLPTGLSSIHSNAFSGCSALETPLFPDSVRKIGSSAFSGCNRFESVSLPLEITQVGPRAFGSCLNLRQVIVHGRTVEADLQDQTLWKDMVEGSPLARIAVVWAGAMWEELGDPDDLIVSVEARTDRDM